MNPTILGGIGPGFLNQVPTLIPFYFLTNCIFRILQGNPNRNYNGDCRQRLGI